MNNLPITREQASVLSPIGRPRTSKGFKVSDEDKAQYLQIPVSFLAMFIGLVDGDGTIRVLRDSKDSLQVALVISLHIDDKAMLDEIASTLGFGYIGVYPKIKRAKFTIRMQVLQEVLFPLMQHHGLMFLTDQRKAQFDKVIYILENKITKFSSLPEVFPVTQPLPVTPQGYLDLPFFDNWLVGFTIAEGSFFIATRGDIGFNIAQMSRDTHNTLFLAILQRFGSTVNLQFRDGAVFLNLTSKADLETVINFFSFSGNHPLMGLKLVSYIKWLKAVATKERFSHIKLPLEAGERSSELAPSAKAKLPIYAYNVERTILLHMFESTNDAIRALSGTIKNTGIYAAMRQDKPYKNLYLSRTLLTDATTGLLSLEELRNYANT